MEKYIETNAGTIIQSGDIIAVMARYKVFFQKFYDIGPEVMDRELLDLSNCLQRFNNYK